MSSSYAGIRIAGGGVCVFERRGGGAERERDGEGGMEGRRETDCSEDDPLITFGCEVSVGRP